VCGRAAPNWGDERRRGLVERPEDTDDAPAVKKPPRVASPALASAPDWHDRQLCSDGACVGVLDDAGVCRVCGTKSPDWRPSASDAALAAVAAEMASTADAGMLASLKPAPKVQVDDDEDDDGDDDDDAGDDSDDDDSDDDDDDDDDADDDDGAQRALCPDGACVGLIGKDGTCKVCGKEAA